jgi:predicted DCC family thiol-disulfide oxidoreductase YuxK
MGAVVLFDGVCNFCDTSVTFVIEHDSQGYFKFAPLQSDAGRDLASKHGLTYASVEGDAAGRVVDSVILIEDDKAYTHSTAALRIARHLDGIWSWAYPLIYIPRSIRDLFYRLFAKYRYRMFGRKDECMIPTPEVRARFL